MKNILLVGWIISFAEMSEVGVLAKTYTTDFSLSENPISENGNWINGGTVGLDWTNVATTNSFAHGTEDGTVDFNDSTALLTGAWGNDQTAQATVHIGTRPASGSYIEVELRLRSSLSAHSCTGYECNYSVAANHNSPYVQIVRWNGALGDFTYLGSSDISQLNDGDVVKASISGNTISTYINGNLILSATDSIFTNGNPGIGFYLQGSGKNDSGFSSFMATDGIVNILAPSIVNDQFEFAFQTVTNQSYGIQQNTNLAGTNWLTLTNITGDGSIYQFNLPVTNNPLGAFVRVREP